MGMLNGLADRNEQFESLSWVKSASSRYLVVRRLHQFHHEVGLPLGIGRRQDFGDIGVIHQGEADVRARSGPGDGSIAAALDDLRATRCTGSS